MAAGQVKQTDIAQLFKRVGEALDAAHARKIIHRDVKPSNILFDASGESFLSDFGIAHSSAILKDGESWLFGTPAYMSAEQIQDADLDGRADVYSLGVVLYRLLTGQFPFAGNSTTTLINAQMESPIPDIREIKSILPAVWQEVLSKAIANDRHERYATAGEFARDVGEVVSGKWYLRKL